MDYYLPDGVWTNYFTNEARTGGRWYRDQCDFFQIPLWVRENTLLPLGAVEGSPVYDYAKDGRFAPTGSPAARPSPSPTPRKERGDRFRPPGERRGARRDLAGLEFTLEVIE